jgi:hypothetical protein
MYFVVEDATVEWMLPIDGRTGKLVDIFDSLEEREFFENELNLDLNTLSRTDNFWHTFRVRIFRTSNLIDDGVVFDLSDPMDTLKVKVLKVQEDIAPNWEQRKKKPKYKWALVDENQEYYSKASESDKLTEAYAHFATIKSSETKMIEFLKIYGSTNNSRKIIPKDAKVEFLKSEISGIIENNIDGYLAVLKGGDFDLKVLLEKAVEVGAIDYKYNKYTLPGGDLINPLDQSYRGTLDELKAWSNPKHEGYEKYLTIKARIENSK